MTRDADVVTGMLYAWQVNEEKEEKRRERARLLLAGHSFTDEDDPFEGLTPDVSKICRF